MHFYFSILPKYFNQIWVASLTAELLIKENKINKMKQKKKNKKNNNKNKTTITNIKSLAPYIVNAFAP